MRDVEQYSNDRNVAVNLTLALFKLQVISETLYWNYYEEDWVYSFKRHL